MITSGPLHVVFFPPLRALSVARVCSCTVSPKMLGPPQHADPYPSTLWPSLKLSIFSVCMCAERTESALDEKIRLSVEFRLYEPRRQGIPSWFDLRESVWWRGRRFAASDPQLSRCSFPKGWGVSDSNVDCRLSFCVLDFCALFRELKVHCLNFVISCLSLEF